MYIESAAGNGQWLIRDYNSGGGLSRMHVRDVRGYIFVNPHGAMARDKTPLRRRVYCQIVLAASTTSASLARSSASVTGLPATVLARMR